MKALRAARQRYGKRDGPTICGFFGANQRQGGSRIGTAYLQVPRYLFFPADSSGLTTSYNASPLPYTVMSLCVLRGLGRSGRPLQTRWGTHATSAAAVGVRRWTEARRKFHHGQEDTKHAVPPAPKLGKLDKFKTYCTYTDPANHANTLQKICVVDAVIQLIFRPHRPHATFP